MAIVAPGRRLADYEEVVAGVAVYRVRALKVLSDRWWVPVLPGRSVEAAIERFRPAVVVVSLPFLLSRAGIMAARKLGVPVVGVTGTMPEWLTANLPLPRGLAQRANPAIWRRLAGYYNQCDAVVGVTRTALGLLRDHGLARPGTVISNGVSLHEFRPRPRDEQLAAKLGVDGRPAVLYAGRLDAEKRLDVWLEAAALTRAAGVDAQFLLVGDGSERRRLAREALRLGLADHVRFIGFLSDGDYQRVFSLASVFAIASPAELQSIVTLEAAASGLPLVAVRAGALPELVEEGRNGFLFPLDDAVGMAQALLKVLTDSELRRRLGAHSRRLAGQHDLERSITGYERLYRSFSGQARGGWRMGWRKHGSQIDRTGTGG